MIGRLLNDFFNEWADPCLSDPYNRTLGLFDLFRPILITNEGISPLSITNRQIKPFLYPIPTLDEYLIKCSGNLETKPMYLRRLLSLLDSKILVFVKSRNMAQRLKRLLKLLEPDWKVEQCSSGVKASTRSRVVDQFNRGAIKVLVCTDLIARGMDLVQVEEVVQYSVPKDGTTYVHRVGRTARAGKQGRAYLLVCGQSEEKGMANVWQDIGQSGNHLKQMEVALSPDDASDLKKALEKMIQ
ncbi:hypothetical protein ACOME3_001778 [Neoechinorhynchus agilis]